MNIQTQHGEERIAELEAQMAAIMSRLNALVDHVHNLPKV